MLTVRPWPDRRKERVAAVMPRDQQATQYGGFILSISSEWDVVVASPIGQQKSLLTLIVDGSTVTGTDAGSMGTWELKDGKASGNQLSWAADITKPMAMRVETEVTVDGDKLEGFIKAGAFGKFKLTGTRRA
ncbi:MAG: hypothetical protein JWO52_7728 [Gammaproteobacteria bacterium]|jgi:hypothetical protein|nr:hypothetical protein [Gammaproteobacteria bacterium]